MSSSISSDNPAVRQPVSTIRFMWLSLAVASAFIPCITTYAFAAVAYLHLGHWPYYAHPDPKNLPTSFYWPYELVFITWFYWIPLTGLLGIVSLRRCFEPEFGIWKTIKWLPIGLTLISGVVAFLMLWAELGLLALVPLMATAYWIGALVWLRHPTERQPSALVPILVLAGLLAVCFTTIFFDPHGVFSWYMD